MPVDGIYVEPHNKRGEKSYVDHQREDDEDAFAVLVEGTEGDVGQEGEWEQQAAEETENVGDVVDPWQQAAHEQEENDAHQLEEGLPWPLQYLPTLEQLHKQAG